VKQLTAGRNADARLIFSGIPSFTVLITADVSWFSHHWIVQQEAPQWVALPRLEKNPIACLQQASALPTKLLCLFEIAAP
jgi:hypothetical protein